MSKKVFKDDELKMPEESFGDGQTQVKHSYVGIILALLIIALLAILAGLYVWVDMIQKQVPPPVVETQRPTPEENNEPESNNAEADAEVLQVTSTSDEIGAIEADLESTRLDELDADLNAIDAEFNAASNQ